MKKSVLSILAGILLFAANGYSKDAVEYFHDSDISCVYCPDTLHPEKSYVELKVLFAHVQDAQDYKSSNFNFEIGDSEYTGIYLYLNDTKFMQLGCQDGDAKALVIDTITNARISDLLNQGWSIRQFTPKYSQAPLNPKAHTCQESHYCYFVIELYPPTSLTGKTIEFRIDGGPDKKYKGDNKWCWWRESGHYNQYGKSSASCTLNYPYSIGTLKVLNGEVNSEGHLVIDYWFTGGNAYNLAEGTYSFGTHSESKNAGFLSNTKDAMLENIDMSGASVVKRYDGTASNAVAKFTMPAAYKSSAKAEATYSYARFPWAELKSVEFDMEDKSAALSWNVNGSNILSKDYVKDGHWYVIRTDNSTNLSMVVSAPLALNTTTWTDQSVEYNKEKGYSYSVVYRQDSWDSAFDSILKSNSVSSGSTNPNCGLVLTTTGLTDRVNISIKWNASKVDGFYKLKLWRGSVLLTSKDNVKAGECSFDYDDINTSDNKLYARISNTYRVQLLNSNDEQFEEQSAAGNITGGTPINVLTATRGNYNDHTELIWTVSRNVNDDTSDTYIIERRTLGEGHAEDRFVEIGRVSSVTSYITYNDMGAAPGEYYEYRVGVLGDQGTILNARTAVGFANATGSISGNVTLSDGTAQSGVKITLQAMKETNTDAAGILLHSLYFNNMEKGQTAEMKIQQDAASYISWMDDEWTVQFWCRPSMDTTAKDQQLLTLPGSAISLRVKTESDAATYGLCKSDRAAGTGTVQKSVKVGAVSKEVHSWAHITLRKQNITSASSASGSRTVRMTMNIAWTDGPAISGSTTALSLKEEELVYDFTESYPEENFSAGVEDGNLSIILGRAITSASGIVNYNGLFDELRIFSRSIDSDQLRDTRLCRLSGSEKGLTCYLPMDEGINGFAFDHGKAGNGNHYATLNPAIIPHSTCPTGFDAYSTTTDAQGFYSIDGIEIPDKVSFMVTASKEQLRESFSPAERFCTLSGEKTTFSNQDFVDNSSVTVNGRVRYRHGTFPVEGCTVYVDGKAAQRDGSNILTDANGEFAVDVPVGNHSLQVALEDHGFINAGRFPATGVYEFQRDTAYIDFTDSTLVLLRGRVSGGAYQASLPLGAGYTGGSQALIGQATLYIAPVSNLSYRINESETITRDIQVSESELVAADTADCNSTEQWLAYEANPVIPGQIVIKTDPLTGEFRALLPPMSYYVTYASTNSVSNDELGTGKLSEFALTPGKESSLIVRYDTKPVVRITDQAHNHNGVNDGMLGEDTLVIDSVSYPVIREGSYAIGCPIFRSGNLYTLEFDAYQEFINSDNAQDAVTRVPMAGELITLSNNQWADGRTDTVRISKNGTAVYQFTASTPSMDEIPLYALEASFTLGTRTYTVPEEPISALFTGFSLTEGMETLVEGPPSVDYVLRDPPGSNSYATLMSGSTIGSKINMSGSNTSGSQSEFHWNIGADINYTTFSVKAISTNSSYDSDTKTTSTNNSMSSSITTTEAYTTGSDAYHVGSAGDVFIGHGTYIGYGKGYCYEASPNNDSGSKYFLKSADGTKTAYFAGKETMGFQTGSILTTFALAQRHIEETLIPEWENIARTATNPDSVAMAENSVNAWKSILAQNEMEKITYTKADTTVSYSAGVTTTITKGISEGVDLTSAISGNTATEWKVGGEGTISVFVYVNVGGSNGDVSSSSSETEHETSQSSQTVVSYTINDNDFMDYQQFDVTYAKSGFIYHLKAGATSNPWEGTEMTKYYSPGSFQIQPATLMVDKCALQVVNPNITDIPNGREATLLIDVTNDSEVGKSDYFYLYTDDESSASGLILTVDGAVVTANGIPLYIPANTTIRKTVKVKQARTDILDFDNAKLFLRNDNVYRFEFDNKDLSPESTFSLHFKPSSSPVTLSARNDREKEINTVNLSSGSKVLLRVTDYQTDYTGFYKMRLQYKAEAETQWHTMAHEYTVAELEGTSQKDTVWDMSELADGTYQLRAVTMSHYGTGDITFESDVVTLVKDMVAPCLLGEPTPANGILDCESQIRFNFSEKIYSGAVTKSNVTVLMRQGSAAPTSDTKYEEIAFDIIVSDEAIQIEPTTEDLLLEGNTLTVRITDIEDLNGNRMEQAVQRDIYVHQCPLVWGAEGTDKAVTLSNISSGLQSWTLQNIPYWLEIAGNVTSGTLLPKEQITLIYSVSDDMPVGEYSGTLRAVDNRGLYVDHDVHAVVTSDLRPQWEVATPGAFFNTTLTAGIDKYGGLNAFDLVGAFIDGMCVGAAYPTHINDEAGYMVMMNIYTDSTHIGKDISLKVYDAMFDVTYTNLLIYNVDSVRTGITAPDNNTTFWGTPDEPWRLAITESIEKSYEMKTGWNWISLFAEIADSLSTPSIFVPKNSEDILDELKIQTGSFTYGEGGFHGDITPAEFVPGILMMSHCNNAYKVDVQGRSFNPSSHPVTLKAKSSDTGKPSYNWVGYTVIEAMPLEDALLQLTPVEGDIIKGQTDYAYYTHGVWVGTLTYLHPTKGYIYTSCADKDRTFCFSEASVIEKNVSNAAERRAAPAASAEGQTAPWEWDPTRWSMNMTALATATLDDKPVTEGYVGIFDAQGLCRSVKPVNEDGRIYLTISGDEKCKLTMRLKTTDGKVYEMPCPFDFLSNDSQGTYTNPIELRFSSDPTALDELHQTDTEDTMYDLNGRRVINPANEGVYIRNGEKVIY